MRGDSPRSSDFRVARIGAAAALIGVLIFILIYDALDADYQVDGTVVTVILGTIGTLLGIEGIASLRNPPRRDE
jgi:uncharacterized membrane protein